MKTDTVKYGDCRNFTYVIYLDLVPPTNRALPWYCSLSKLGKDAMS